MGIIRINVNTDNGGSYRVVYEPADDFSEGWFSMYILRPVAGQEPYQLIREQEDLKNAWADITADFLHMRMRAPHTVEHMRRMQDVYHLYQQGQLEWRN